jgi:hypothetical protein
VKRYTDFSELTTAMLNEFVEKVVVHEGDKRGNDRCQRVDIHMNFIGTFEVPADIITPMELAEQRRQQEEQAAKEKRLKESEQARYEQRKADKREFTARKKAGRLTPEEIKADEQDRARRREWQKEWRDKRKAAEPPKPPKPLSQNKIIKRKYAGLPLTDEEYAIYRAWQDKKTEHARERRESIKATEPPKTKKLTQLEVVEKSRAGLPLTPEEQEQYNRYWERRRGYNKEQYEKRRAADLSTAANQ